MCVYIEQVSKTVASLNGNTFKVRKKVDINTLSRFGTFLRISPLIQ